MAYYSQSSGAWSEVARWNSAADGSGSAPAAIGDLDDNAVVIQDGHDIEFDVDMSGYANGIAGLTIEGGATPGMLYCKYSAAGTYHLKIKTGTNIVGTTGDNLGRILANSDGVWANSTALPNDRRFIIELDGTASGKIAAQYLDIKLYCTEPTNKYVHVYGTKYDFDAATEVNTTTGVITLNTTAPAEGTDVILLAASGATLPTGLYADRVYYVRDNSLTTCKLATTNSDDTIVIPSAAGSGTIYMLTEPASGTTVLNVFEDVTADAPWSASAGSNEVVLVDAQAPDSYDQQRTTIASIDSATQITLAASVDSTQYAGARLILLSRNIQIRSESTSSSQSAVDFTSQSTAVVNVLGCQIIKTAWSGTTYYGYGIYSGSGHTINGNVSGCTYGIYSGSGHTISGTVSGCTYGIYSGSGHTINGNVSGCTYGLIYGSGHIISGNVSGCSSGISYGSGHTISGNVSGCSSGVYSGSGHIISGNVSGCSSGISYGSGYIVSGTITGNSYSFRGAVGFITIKREASVTYTFYDRGTGGQPFRIAAEDHAGTADAAKIYDNMGDIIRTACDGATANYPDTDPDGGSGYAIEGSNLQAPINATNPLYLISDRAPHRIWLTAGTWTITYKVYTTFDGSGGIADNGLTIAATYISAASPRTITRSTDSQAIATKTSDTDWTQTLAITITTAAEGWVDIDIYLTEYEASKAVFIWPTPTITAS